MSPRSSLPVFVVDDDPSVLRALERLLRGEGYRVATCSCSQEFIKSPKSLEPGCVILDMMMPGLNGLDVQNWLLKRNSSLSVIFLTAYGKIDECVGALKSGAVDFLTKPVSDEALLSAVEKALIRSDKYHKYCIDLERVRERARRLSPREHEVFCLVVTGLLNKQIAAELGTAEKTIKVHRARVLDKMEAGSLAELVMMADKLGLIEKSS